MARLLQEFIKRCTVVCVEIAAVIGWTTAGAACGLLPGTLFGFLFGCAYGIVHGEGSRIVPLLGHLALSGLLAGALMGGFARWCGAIGPNEALAVPRATDHATNGATPSRDHATARHQHWLPWRGWGQPAHD